MSTVNVLPTRDMAASKTGCCPPFEPAEWDKQIFEFQDKLFAKVSTRSLFHFPLNMGSVMKRVMAQIDAADAASNEYLTLSDEVSAWRADHYVAVTKEVPEIQMVRLSGTFLTKVFEGAYQDMPKWYDQLNQYAQAQGKSVSKTYFCYTMCPKCAKAYGKNYVVGFAQVA